MTDIIQGHSRGASPRIGHVHLRVADLDRAIAFYRDALGFTLNIDGRAFGVNAAFLAIDDYHHDVALNTFESAGGAPPPVGHTGLHHVAFAYPDRASLAAAVARVAACGRTLDGGRDHGATLSVYLEDPDGNGLELYYDRPRAEWFDRNGRLVVRNDPFDVGVLIAEAEAVRAEATAVEGCLAPPQLARNTGGRRRVALTRPA